ncbi:peptidase E [Fictibacillus terranigra]|uniref:Peptidase E n=1 Tax=Fictibacillus terranigra TaxID=3058424 RepID=A0ABT8E301_9BACL|nr:peptidase E [Fictibacillus sp. CENA-BCM004]MDN4072288.1 peptidase E [Fictibacillus sp. CENA-BCM004]
MKQIIALGGGGFSMEPENPLLDQYILRQSRKNNPKICFLPTASGDADGYVERFYQSFKQHECIPSHLSLFKPPSVDLKRFVLDQDVIYVGGGNTRNLMALWREWGLDHILHEAYVKGIVLAGISAGALCWFEEGVTDSIPGKLTRISCLGLLKGSHCPHYDGEENRRPSYHDLILHGLSEGYAADDGAGLHFIDGELAKIISSRPYAKGYKVSKNGGRIIEDVLPTDYLGS